MGYYIRFIFEGEARPDLKAIRALLKNVDAAYSVTPSEAQPDDPPGAVYGDILLGKELIGALELRDVQDPGSDEDIQGLLEEIEDIDDNDAVSATLWNASALLSVQVLWQGDDHGESVRKLNPLWSQLFSAYTGVVQADDEGYYGPDGELLEL